MVLHTCISVRLHQCIRLPPLREACIYTPQIWFPGRRNKQSLPGGRGRGGVPLTKYHIKLTYTQHVNGCSSLHRLSLDVDPPVLKEEVGIREHVHCVPTVLPVRGEDVEIWRPRCKDLVHESRGNRLLCEQVLPDCPVAAKLVVWMRDLKSFQHCVQGERKRGNDISMGVKSFTLGWCILHCFMLSHFLCPFI